MCVLCVVCVLCVLCTRTRIEVPPPTAREALLQDPTRRSVSAGGGLHRTRSKSKAETDVTAPIFNQHYHSMLPDQEDLVESDFVNH